MTLRLFGLGGIIRAQAICDGCGATVTAAGGEAPPRDCVPPTWAWVSPVGAGHALCADVRPNPTRAPCERYHSVYLCNGCGGLLAPVRADRPPSERLD